MSKTIDPTARLTDGFQPSQIPAGPDGIPSPIPVRRSSSLEVINLCSLGPCSHYHELATKVDSQDPLDGSPGGVYVNITRTCYPAPGIEIDVSEHQVRRCSIWEPRFDQRETLERIRNAYLATDDGAEEWAAFEASWPTKEK